MEVTNLIQDTKSLIEGSQQIRLQIHEKQKRLISLGKIEATVVARFNSVISADKALSNADKRKAALAELKAKDEEYIAVQAETEVIQDEVELLKIQLQFNIDMTKLNLVLLSPSSVPVTLDQ